jgi:hypothetical protein
LEIFASQGTPTVSTTLAAKFAIGAISVIDSCPNKIIKTFLIEDIFHLPTVSMTAVVHLELQISSKYLKKFETALLGILRGLGETDS